jgi:hypothetical protein
MSHDFQHQLTVLHLDLGLKRLNPIWAKIEIIGGLATAGAGLKLLINDTHKLDPTGGIIGLAAFVLGGYLAMAGHRSHLYQSNNLLTAWLRASETINDNGTKQSGSEELRKTGQ